MSSRQSFYSKRVTIALNPGLIEQIDALAAEFRLGRSLVMRYALEAGLRAARSRIEREAGPGFIRTSTSGT